jgi:ATP-dependent Clp protease ATP-binding subunit ClpC
MFELFTDPARRAIVLAQEEARRFDHTYIGTEHLLLGLLREGEGVATTALKSLGVSLEAARRQVEESPGRGRQAPGVNLPFTPGATKALELAKREALASRSDHIGTGHVLLGLLREGEGTAAQVLIKLGADVASTRRQVAELLAARAHEEGGTGTPQAPRAWAERGEPMEALPIGERLGRMDEALRQLTDQVGHLTEQVAELLRRLGPPDSPGRAQS